MTPRRDELKLEVGVRELHDHLSRYVRHVGEGGEVFITMRGRRVARMSAAGDDALAALRERGLVRDPVRSRRKRGLDSLTEPEGDVSGLVRDQRR